MDNITLSIILITVLTFLILVGIWFFGIYLFKDRELLFRRGIELDLLDELRRNNRPEFIQILNSINNYLHEFLEKRNEFWTSYGQLIISIFIVSIISILLLTKIITAEAGLPLLSAISGFAVAKTATTRSKGNDNIPNRPQ